MKQYSKPTIEIAVIASSAPIAALSCSGDDITNYEFKQTTIVQADGTTYVEDLYVNGST